MGSFNTTCFATNQTIAPGDKCRILPISQQSTYSPVTLAYGEKTEAHYGVTSSTCYPDSFWKPAGTWLEAEYDDCGSSKLLQGPQTRVRLLSFFDQVLMRCPNVAEGENTRQDIAFDFASFLSTEAPGVHQLLQAKDSFFEVETLDSSALDEELDACWDYIFEVAAENRLFIQDYRGIPRPLQFAVLHERTYQALLETVSTRLDRDGGTVDMAEFLERSLVKAVAAEETLKADFGEPFPLEGWFFSDSLRESFRNLGDPGARELESAVLAQLSKKFIRGTLSLPDFVEAFKPHLADRYLFAALLELNLRFSPMVYATQDYSNDVGQAYAALTAKVSQQITKERKFHRFGKFSKYSVQVPTPADFEALAVELEKWDSDADDVTYQEITALLEVHVTFSSPSDLEHLREVIGRLPSSVLMLETLQAL